MISRRNFIKQAGMATAAVSGAGLWRCAPSHQALCTRPVGGRVIDVHLHTVPEKLQRTLEVMDDNCVRYGVCIAAIAGPDPDQYVGDKAFYELLEGFQAQKNRIGVAYTFDWSLAATDPDFFAKAPDMLEKAVTAGAVGMKVLKDLGLTVKDQEGKLLAIDDPRLFPIWERAEKLGIPVAIHTGDPVAFFKPWNPQNERWEELKLHPEWSFADPAKYPTLEAVLEQQHNVIRKFKNIRFQCVHLACLPEDIKAVARWLDEMPNMHLDIAARVGELGKHPAVDGKAFFTKYQDRIMFGTDMQFWANCDVQGAGPCRDFTREEDRNFYNIHWRYLQTTDTRFDHPTPIQGNWKIDGIGLPAEVLKKIYWDNAFRFYRLDRFGVA
jgi:predicted TIM-barrel fold metal-dependent hydrolase